MTGKHLLEQERLTCDDKPQGLAALVEAEKALHLSAKLTNQLLTFDAVTLNFGASGLKGFL